MKSIYRSEDVHSTASLVPLGRWFGFQGAVSSDTNQTGRFDQLAGSLDQIRPQMLHRFAGKLIHETVKGMWSILMGR